MFCCWTCSTRTRRLSFIPTYNSRPPVSQSALIKTDSSQSNWLLQARRRTSPGIAWSIWMVGAIFCSWQNIAHKTTRTHCNRTINDWFLIKWLECLYIHNIVRPPTCNIRAITHFSSGGVKCGPDRASSAKTSLLLCYRIVNNGQNCHHPRAVTNHSKTHILLFILIFLCMQGKLA